MQGRCIVRVGGYIRVGANTDAGNTFPFIVCGRTWSWLIVVVHNVDIHTLTSIAAVATEIIDDVIAHIHSLV